MEDNSSRLLPDYASSETREAVVHAALHDAIIDIFAESDAEDAPNYVLSSLETVQRANSTIALSISAAMRLGEAEADDLEQVIARVASAEYSYFAAVTRWRAEWLAALRAGGKSVNAPPPHPSEFLAVCGEALEDAFPYESWEATPQHVMGAIKELTRDYLAVAQSLRAITMEQGHPSSEVLAIAAKVLANMSETEATVMGVMIAWRVFWIMKWRRCYTERPD